MALKDEINQDVLSFFNKIEGLSHRDRLEMLRLTLEKYALLSQSDCILDRSDLLSITSHAKNNMANDQSLVHLGERCTKLNYDEVRMFNTINAVIMVLNGKECFKRLPKFDVKVNEFKDGDV